MSNNLASTLLAHGIDGDVAVIDGDRSFTYRDLRAATAQLAAALESSPAAPGDRVAIAASNSFFWVASYLATLATGRVAVPIATVTPVDEVQRQAAWVDTRVFFADRSQTRRLAAALADTAVIGEETLVGEPLPRSLSLSPAEVHPSSDAIIQFTSGTTAAPKAVKISHGNLRANADAIISYLGLERDDRMLVVLPFSYCFGLSLLNTHLSVGASVVLGPTMTFPETVVSAIAHHSCTGFAGVPSTYQVLLKASSFDSRTLPTLRHIQQAGGKLAPSLVDQLVAAQPGARVFVMYGQTEATSRLSYLDPSDLVRKRGSIGRGLPGQPLRVVDGDDRDVAPGEVGEIIVAGAGVTGGYWNDAAATAEKYRGGWLRTGDLATIDDDGYVFVVDRLSDFIKSWGFRVSSQEVEEAALAVPEVVSAAAIGVPDDLAGEAIVLFAVVSDPAVTADDILAAVRRGLPKHMVPSVVRVIDEIPKNANGKTLKASLREMVSQPGALQVHSSLP